MWEKKNDYYFKNGDWTICQNGIETVKYGLWHGNVNKGWFDTSAEAIAKWKVLNSESQPVNAD